MTLLGASLLLATACAELEELMPSVTGVSLSETSLTMLPGDEVLLVATVEPADAFNKNVTWSTSDSFIADVYDGKVLACAPGKAVITVRTQDGGKTATCEVTVLKEGESVPQDVAVTGVTLDSEKLTMEVGDRTLLIPTVEPENATNKNVTWASSDEEVAAVDEDGIVTAIAPGRADITVTTVDGGFTAVCPVEVLSEAVAVTGVRLDYDEISMDVGQSFALKAYVEPDDATNKNVNWFTDDPEVADVDENGLVTATGEGETYISVITEDGDFTAYCHVIVSGGEVPPAGFVKMSHARTPDLNIARGDFNMFVCGNDVVAVGGHVYDFDITSSVEIFKEGAWHQANSTSTPHDMGFAVKLQDGTVMVGGGCSTGWGIGQLSTVEIYNPDTYSFSSGPSLSRERTICRAALLDNGQVVVSGNWYAYDAIEVYTPGEGFTYVGETSEQRSVPYIIPTAADNAMIFGVSGNYGGTVSPIVDRLIGDNFFPILFEEWTPASLNTFYMMEDARIGQYQYLFSVTNNEDGSIALVVTNGEDMSLLPLESAIPTSTEWGTQILYMGGVHVDREKQVAYLIGRDRLDNYDPDNLENNRVYITAVKYGDYVGGKQCSVITYYSDNLDDFGSGSVVVLPDGGVMMAGGITNSNFTPYSDSYIFYPF